MIKFWYQNNYVKSYLINKLKFNVSVYQGISPALLATMSLSQGVKGNTNQQLINSLTKNNIIRNKRLQKIMKAYDRKLFIPKQLNHKHKANLYQNKPYKIHGGQNMTDIFTHAVILEQTCFRIQEIVKKMEDDKGKQVRILDVGTGHGYLAFIITSFINQTLKDKGINFNYQAIGIDLSNKAVQYAQELKDRLILQNKKQYLNKISLSHESLQDRLSKQQNYHIVIGGFYMPPNLHESLINNLQKSSKQLQSDTYGVWATDSSSGQSLYSFICQRQKMGKQNFKIGRNQIMSTMFSMPTVKTSVSKYFVDQQASAENSSENLEQKDNNQMQQQSKKQQINQQQIRKQLLELKAQKKKQQKQKLKEQLKLVIQKYSKKMNKRLKLQQMKNIQQINVILQKLNKK